MLFSQEEKILVTEMFGGDKKKSKFLVTHITFMLQSW